ncbi:MAG: glucosyltransferase domain-containing protein [Oscillospiraceae bacterium]|nr:glucosyltransferase domain-containing protein [Oscillospiraceae bacterium]
MEQNGLSFSERLAERLGRWFLENRLPFLSTLIAGLLAHAFVLTNKLPNHDDVSYLFNKGETIRSGRWGLELLRYVIPDISMPWLHGITSLLLLAVSVCLIVRLFRIRSRLSQVLLSALIISFPSQTGTFCYMFTSSAYAVAFLFSVLAVWEARKPHWKHWLFSSFCIVLTFSIYQAYIPLTASLMILLLIRDILDAGSENCALAVFKRGLLYLAILLIGLEVYRLTITFSLSFVGGEVNRYTNEAQYMAPKFPDGIAVAYRFFFYNLSSRYNMLIVSRLSRALHFLALALTLAGLICSQIRSKNPANALMLLFCLAILPFGICCLYAVIYWNAIHTLVLYSYIALYVLMFIAIDELPRPVLLFSKDLLYASLGIVLAINICFANRTYMKLFLEYENAYSLATTLVTQIRSLPGYNRDMEVAIYPSAGTALSFAPEFGTKDENDHDIMGVQAQLLTGYTEEDFFRYYLGQELNVLSREEAEDLYKDERVQAMPVYPDAGSIAIIDDVIFIRFA